MQKAIDETNRRRTMQLAYNQQHGITPETIRKEIRRSLTEQIRAEHIAREAIRLGETEYDKVQMAAQLEREMFEAAEALDFERAAALRDQLRQLKELPELIASSRTKKDVARKTRRGRQARS